MRSYSGMITNCIIWTNQDSSAILDWKQAQRAIFPNLKPTLKSISLRLPESMLDELRQLANERDIPYQSLIKMYLRERINKDLHEQVAE